MPRFSLDFSGLCAFVPKISLDEPKGAENNRVRVLMADAMGHRGGGPAEEHHEPVLLLPKASVDREDGRYRRGWSVEISGEDYVCFSLAHQDLWIGDDDGEAALKVDVTSIGADGDCPDLGSNAASFRWVASMKEIYPSASVANRDLVLEADPLDLGARVLLDRGTLGAGTFSGDGTGKVTRWGFESPGRGRARVRRALAESVDYVLDLEAASVVLTTRHLILGSTERIKVRLDGGVEGRIRNMPWPDILEQRCKDGEINYHFTHFYDLSERPPRRSYRRLPKNDGDIMCPRLRRMVSNPKCPPVQFEADPDV